MNNKLLILLAVIIAIGAYYAQKASLHITPPEQQELAQADDHRGHHMPASGEVTTTGKAAIGGDFTLTDQNGAPYTQDNLLGHYSLVFFGFSNCPDMCPTALTTITSALDSLPEDVAARITPVFITVDPERDTQAALAEYASNFHPSLVALTGSKEATDDAAAEFKVFHQKGDPQAEDYMVNHSGYIYVMNPQGEYAKHFAHTTPAQTIAAQMQTLVEQPVGQ